MITLLFISFMAQAIVVAPVHSSVPVNPHAAAISQCFDLASKKMIKLSCDSITAAERKELIYNVYADRLMTSPCQGATNDTFESLSTSQARINAIKTGCRDVVANLTPIEKEELSKYQHDTTVMRWVFGILFVIALIWVIR